MSSSYPSESGTYHIIAIMSIPNPDNAPDLIVRDGDTIVTEDYYNADNHEWEKFPDYNYGTDWGWKMVAWKEISLPMLPSAYKNAVRPNQLPIRLCYIDEKQKNLLSRYVDCVSHA